MAGDRAGHSAAGRDGVPTVQAVPRGARRGWLTVALGAVLLGAFVVSASSTWQLGERHHLGDLARVALIAMLEVGSITGASLYVSTRDRRTRVRAGLLVAIATGVAATGGVQAYGFLIGLSVAAVLLLMVEVISRYWHETGPVPAEQPQAPSEEPPTPVQVPAERPALVSLPGTGTDDTTPVPVPKSTTGPARARATKAKHSDEVVVAWLREQLADPQAKDPTVDAVVERFSTGRTRAVRLCQEAKA
ncbi:hypothetical protein [Actinomycetospora termitidis]|uniref:Uncharacterized protein n=1 Tax=Actinomycetospora termitidis TaxID=3053470 RepID=A0ABT7MHN0_9PSEU|nr:hypothetical protein [Actinomycetospora sp. Odt1-22]MDL5159447.1 hypothetical protein [Actinomycetospora sp. Odt1-22]